MTTPSPSDGTDRTPPPEPGDAPFLPPARPVTPTPAVDLPHLPPAHPPEPVAARSAAAPTATATFDAAAMVESQKHFNANPAYGAMPVGTDESRAAARKLRDDANRRRRRGKALGRVFLVLVLAGAAVGGFFVYRAIQDDPPPLDPPAADDGPGTDDAALTPLGEQEAVIGALDDLTSGVTPGAGGLLDAVEEARDLVGRADPPPADAAAALVVAEVFTPAVLDHTDVLDPAEGWERFVVRAGALATADPGAHTALVDRLLALAQVADDERLTAAPVVLPGDIGIAIRREDDRIVTLVAVAADPVIRSVGP
jgi:hypothetical protein